MREQHERLRTQLAAGDGPEIEGADERRTVEENLKLIESESNAWNVAAGFVNGWSSSVNDLRALSRKACLMRQVPDYRCEAAKYTEKQDVEYCTYRVENIPRLCCKTIAVEMVQAYVGTEASECNINNYTLWYNRVSRFNLSPEVRIEASLGTIMFAHDTITHMRKSLGLPISNAFSVVQGLVYAGERATDVISGLGKISEAVVNTALGTPTLGDNPKAQCLANITGTTPTGLSLPTILISGAKFIAGLPYGVFGVRRMRPLKKNF